MWTMLAGVPGKLKTMLDRLTATRAANLDKLDANITTRAAASTALSNAVWTDARAEKLDNVGVPFSPTDLAVNSASLFRISGGGSRTAVGSTVVLDVNGRGVLHKLSSTVSAEASSDAGALLAVFIVEIDGNVISLPRNLTLSANNSSSNTTQHVGDVAWIEHIPFYSNLKVTLTITSSSMYSQSLQAACMYRRVS